MAGHHPPWWGNTGSFLLPCLNARPWEVHTRVRRVAITEDSEEAITDSLPVDNSLGEDSLDLESTVDNSLGDSLEDEDSTVDNSSKGSSLSSLTDNCLMEMD